jgi:RHS repeat-associated protein
LARSSGYSSGSWTSHAYYHADGNGNITTLIDGSQSVVANYRYDPFGNTLLQSGTLADANVYRFSSKEVHTNSLMYYYGYRFYDPVLQRWLNRDPVEDLGFIILAKRISFDGSISPNAYTFVKNNSIGNIDAHGLTLYYCTVPTSSFPTFGIGRHGYLWNDATGDECGQESSCGSGTTKSDNGGPGPNDTKPDRSGRVCTPIEGTEGTDPANADLMAWCHQHANDGVWIPGAHDCHNAVNKCLNHGGLQPILFPGRFHPQPIWGLVPRLSSVTR